MCGAATTVVVGPYFRGRSFGEPFGTAPGSTGLLPAERQVKNVLEVYLYGGLSPWETFYAVEEYGRPDDPNHPNEQLHAFLGTGDDSIESAMANCGLEGSAPMLTPFATDANGVGVNLGPFAFPLRERSDLTDRMRMLVQSHQLEPHEAAVPQALTGRPVGQPSAAGLGSHIQRFLTETGGRGRNSPYSYLFATGGISSDNVSAAVTTGLHPGSARPLKVTITNAERFAELLGRNEVASASDPALYDKLTNFYADQYQERLTWAREGKESVGEAVARSKHFTDLRLAVDTVGRVEAIGDVLIPELFEPRSGESCSASRNFDVPGMSLEAARHLLTHPTEPAGYVCVSDIGLYQASGGGGYDTHTDNSFDTAMNFSNVLKHISSIVNRPDESDPTKLNLDDTLIILNTEFGRTPRRQGKGTGRNHWPYGYVTAFIGGPITKSERGISGAIGPDGRGRKTVTPAENRIAALLSMGIWPFAQESFAVSDALGAASEMQAAFQVTEKVLGIKL